MIHQGDTAPKAAGVIHTDFERGFIKAEVVSFSDLVDAGYLDRQREGRRNFYRVRPDQPLRHPVEGGHHIGEILTVLHAHDGAGGRGGT